VDMNMDAITIVAGLLHDVVEDTHVDLEELKTQYGDEVAMIVNGVTKLSKISFKTQEERQAENFRKMFLAIAEDIRVILIKLADRLNNMRTLKFMPAPKRLIKAKETLDIYVPIANRLGLNRVKWELEDCSLYNLAPKEYNELAVKVAKSRAEREKYIESIKEKMGEELRKFGIVATIQGRPKNIYSIYKKMQEQDKDFFQIYDLMAIRIICNSIKDCYAALGFLHSIWKPMPGRFKDYIAMPKSNMYQSLHTTVITSEGEPLEVQIRTMEMHRTSEYGIAAHWKYKEKGDSLKDKKFEERLSWLRQILEWQKELKDPREFMENLKIDLLQYEVYTFTPKGDVKVLPLGSTPVDFAYTVHTEIGHKCVGAKVNNKIVPLDRKLNSGDIVEILTSKTSTGPSRDWLKFVKTSSAKTRIKSWFKREVRNENIEKGRGLLSRELDKYKIIWNSDLEEKFNSFSQPMGYTDFDSLLEAIGYKKISPVSLINKILPQEEKKEIQTKEKSEAETVKRIDKGVKIEGVDNILVRFAHCCHPVPGDEIIGYITRGRGVTIHRTECPNLKNISEEEGRLINVEWHKSENDYFPVKIKIISSDRKNIISDVSMILSNFKASIMSINGSANKNGMAFLNLTIEVSTLEHLKEIITRLRSLRAVKEVKRIGKD
ncbi:MAG: bifunctional (p)ppGpp synthetase/guanosine-3',5'-bis(diphosphate) 3'-pyrophosphohydrolase, partial [Atribacterota bacterium]|nr:bifunctional (p)ppGpp synthetase/guanosine-3',5'-bis(diphosphate) 3'-pyrophosphohydrolase [Atribacterota bacterium]